MIRAIIIDDERSSRNVLQQLIRQYCKEVEVEALADNALTGKKMIDDLHPDLVFLDIEMPFQSGFELLESMENKSFKVVFVTAHDFYKSHASKFHPLDFLLKPISPGELKAAIEKFSKD